MIDHINGKSQVQNQSNLGPYAVMANLLQDGHFYALETGKSEDLAAFAHFFLTVTPFGQVKRDWQKDIGGSVTKPSSDVPAAKPVQDTKIPPSPKASDNKGATGDDKSAKKSKVADEPIPSDEKSSKSKSNKK